MACDPGRRRRNSADHAVAITQLVFAFLLVDSTAADPVPGAIPATGARLLVEVAATATRREILSPPQADVLETLRTMGVPEDDLYDGSVARGMSACCDGANGEPSGHVFYVPLRFRVAPGDIVEIESRPPAPASTIGALAIAVAVRQRAGTTDPACRWYLREETGKARTLYCDWMPLEGWVRRPGATRQWYRPPDEATGRDSPAEHLHATGDCSSDVVLVDPGLRGIVRNAAAARAPMIVQSVEEAGAGTCGRTISLHFASTVDRTRQTANRDGAAIMGVAGMLLGSVTPWSCPTTHHATAELRHQSGMLLGEFSAERLQKRMGTMLRCSQPDRPKDDIVQDLTNDILYQVQQAFPPDAGGG